MVLCFYLTESGSIVSVQEKVPPSLVNPFCKVELRSQMLWEAIWIVLLLFDNEYSRHKGPLSGDATQKPW